MRRLLTIGGILLVIISIPSYYYVPYFLTNSVHSFVASMMSGGGTTSGVSMLRQMGYPPLHVVISISQYLLMALVYIGLGLVVFGLISKDKPKAMAVKIVADERFGESHSDLQSRESKAMNSTQASSGNEQVTLAVNDVLTKLETELKQIKTGYEEHRDQMEDEKKKLEQKERERMAKIISTGEVLIKEITPDRFEERTKYYVGLKNEDTGQLIDLSLLAEKFDMMKKRLDSAGRSDLTSREFDDFKKFLDR